MSESPVGERLGSERLYDGDFPHPEDVVAPPPKRVKQEPKPAMPPPQPQPERATPAQSADKNWRGIISSGLELAGIAAITAGCALIQVWLALIVGGIALVVLGVATGLNPRDE